MPETNKGVIDQFLEAIHFFIVTDLLPQVILLRDQPINVLFSGTVEEIIICDTSDTLAMQKRRRTFTVTEWRRMGPRHDFVYLNFLDVNVTN
jgi:hypothetical protein